jgi:hypothetical protein
MKHYDIHKKHCINIKLFADTIEMLKGNKTSHHDLNVVGYRRATYAFTKGCKNVNYR